MIAMSKSCSQPCAGSDPGSSQRKRSKQIADAGGYGKHLSRLLTAEEERALAARIKVGDSDARKALIVANLRLAVHVAKRYRSSGATLDDLIQEGTRGLIRAARDYDPELHNTRFSSYATYWVRHMIQRAVAANYSLVRLPDYMFRLRNQFWRWMVRPEADRRDVPVELTMPPQTDQFLLRTMTGHTHFSLVGDEGEVGLFEEAIADRQQPEREVERQEAIDVLNEALARLTPIEAWVIRRRFGLGESSVAPAPGSPVAREKTRRQRGRASFAHVGRILGISPFQVQKIEQIALQKLRHYLEPRVAPDGVLDL
jgi:RNA polymerase sigma factor (sigma-70 family)